MKSAVSKIKPASGFSKIFYWLLIILLPLLALVFVRLSILPLAYGVVILSKWRMFAIRPRHWPASIRLNAINIIMGLSFVVFMAQSSSLIWQLLWVIAYEAWLLYVKPKSKIFWVSVQASLGQFLGLMALYLLWGRSSLAILVLASGVICYLSARHFFSAFEEPLSSTLAYIWSYIAVALTWVLGHWLLYYGFVSQAVLLLSVLSYGLGTLYYLDNFDKLSSLVKREIILIMLMVVMAIIVFSSWGDKSRKTSMPTYIERVYVVYDSFGSI